VENTDTDVNAGADMDADIDTAPDAIISSGQVRSAQLSQVISDQMDRTFSYSSVESAGVYRSEDITIA
jgi:hypothetical protein